MFKSFRILSLALVASAILASCSSIKPVAPACGSEVTLHTPIQMKFLRMPREERRAYFADKACRKELASEGFWPKPVLLEWETCRDCGKEFSVTISTSPNFDDGTCAVYTTKEKKLEVTNLMIATTYYWKVQCGERCSAVSSFVTEDVAPRLLNIPMMMNCRDLGGRIGIDGRRVKQNMAIRTAGLNRNAKPIVYTMEELQSDPNFVKRLEDIKSVREFLLNAPRKEIPYLLDGEWTVFRPDMEAFGDEEMEMVDALTEIPESFLGAKGVKMIADEKYAVDLNGCTASRPGVLMMDFVAPEEGIMPFTCGADWYWYLRLNGATLYDRRRGNSLQSGKDNYMLYLPVRKGHNLLTVYLGSGATSFVWYCAPVPHGTALDAVVASGLKENQNVYDVAVNIGRLDENGNPLYEKGEPYVNEEGIDYLLNTLGLKSDIDLRGPAECGGMTGSPAGDTVKWHHISSSSYAGMQGFAGREAFSNVFKVFLDEKNYPIDFHCIAGQDRTGAVAFIINALLGVAEEELYLDWECTGFWNTSVDFCHELRFDLLVEGFQRWPGDSINEKVENYVLSLGFTKEDIEHLRDILLEK